MRALRCGGAAQRRALSESGVRRRCGFHDGIHQEGETGRFSASVDPVDGYLLLCHLLYISLYIFCPEPHVLFS